MSSFAVLAIFSAIVVMVYCKEEGNPMKTFYECAKENGLDIKKIKEIKKTKEMEKIPKGFFCTIKCLWDKEEYLKDGKPDTEKLKTHYMLMSMMKDENKFLKCIAAIEPVKDCDGAKQIQKCTQDNHCDHIEECAKEIKVDEDEFVEWFHKYMEKDKKKDNEEMPKNIMCMQKCIFEKKGLLGKDGKFDKEKVKSFFHKIRNQEPFLKCIEGLKITKCEDMKGSIECMKEHAVI